MNGRVPGDPDGQRSGFGRREWVGSGRSTSTNRHDTRSDRIFDSLSPPVLRGERVGSGENACIRGPPERLSPANQRCMTRLVAKPRRGVRYDIVTSRSRTIAPNRAEPLPRTTVVSLAYGSSPGRGPREAGLQILDDALESCVGKPVVRRGGAVPAGEPVAAPGLLRANRPGRLSDYLGRSTR